MEEGVPNILVVEDNNMVAQGIKKIFTRQGYNVEIAVDGMDAMEKLMNNVYDMVITDLAMPNVTGQQLIQAIKRNLYKDVKIIVITSTTDEVVVAEMLALGADDYVTKPFNAADLLNRVKKLL